MTKSNWIWKCSPSCLCFLNMSINTWHQDPYFIQNQKPSVQVLTLPTYSFAHLQDRVQISNLQIAIWGSNLSFTDHFKQFLWNSQINLSFCWNFHLQGNYKVLVYTSSLTNCLYLTPKSVSYSKKFSCIWIAFWSQTPNGGLTALPDTL